MHVWQCVSGVGIIGLPACVVTAFQFGIGERPNASSAYKYQCSFIDWFACSLFDEPHVCDILDCIIFSICRCSVSLQCSRLLLSVSVCSDVVYLRPKSP